MARASLMSSLISSIIDAPTKWLGGGGSATTAERLIEQCERLISSAGEASGVALAQDVLASYAALDADFHLEFFTRLATDFDPAPEQVLQAANSFAADNSPQTLKTLMATVEPKRRSLLRKLNQAPGGTEALVHMREALLPLLRDHPELKRVDADFEFLFNAWFNRGFLVLYAIDWSFPANVLEKLLEYEAVHEIQSWDDLKSRVQPQDRRCFAFFHPAMPDEPLIFVQVALMKSMPAAIDEVFDPDREEVTAEQATTAVFYSITNCQVGLRGVSFGNFLIKQVASDLSRELPGLKTFCTLSPVPGFGKWARQDATAAAAVTRLETIQKTPDWQEDKALSAEARSLLEPLAARYFLREQRSDGQPIDPVARFHLGNGAILDRLNPAGNLSARGLDEALGLMVNYRYDLSKVEENHEAYVNDGFVTASKTISDLAK